MCTGIALPRDELPLAMLEDPRIRERIYSREGREEVQFHWWQTPTVLPVRWRGRLQLIAWGSKARRRSPLPVGGWLTEEDLQAGTFAASRPEAVVIPAVFGHHVGTWFLINEGIRGVVVDSPAGPVVYMLVQPASNYYRNMTEQSPTMPIFVGQVI